MSDSLELLIQVAVENASDSQLDDDVANLRRQLLDLPSVDNVKRLSAEPGQGSKSSLGTVLGGLVVTAGPVAVAGLRDIIKTWLHTRSERSIEVSAKGKTLKVKGGSSKRDQELLDEFFSDLDK